MIGGIITAGTKEYIERFGSVTFDEFPFCEADATLLSQMIYMPLEWVKSDEFVDNPPTIADVCEQIMPQFGGKPQKLGLMIPADAGKRLVSMAAGARYQNVKVAAVSSYNSTSPAVQFGAGSFILPDGTNAIVFRGTDDTLFGWKEDLDLLLHKGIPSYSLALDFLEKAAAKYGGPIMLIGHSKGGNIALYTALNCSAEIRSRLSYIFNADGPGYYDASVLDTEAYKEILPVYHHFIPSGSMIGVMLSHDSDYTPIRSTRHIGALQHDLGTWKIEGGSLLTAPDTDYLSKLTEHFISAVIEKVSSGYPEAADTVISKVMEGIGEATITDVVMHLGSAVKGGIDAWKSIDPVIKEQFSATFSGSLKALGEGAKALKGKVPLKTVLGKF